jgi:hypothetical protein
MIALRMLALMLTALIWAPGAAHLFELPGKIGLGRDAYFTVQGIYAGWALFGIPIFAAILANLALSLAERRRDRSAARWALAAALLIAATLAIFFALVFPANRATANWTLMPQDWEDLRRQWEYGHAVNAGILFLALLATGLAVAKRGSART